MYQDERSSQSLDHSEMMIVSEEYPNSSKKRKLGQAEESDLLPQPKHVCLEKQASFPKSSSPSSDIEFAECSYRMEETKTRHQTYSSSYSTGSSSCGSTIINNIDQYCSKANDKTQEYIEDLSYEDFICPEFAAEDLQEVQNPALGSYIPPSARWSINNNQDSEETTTEPTIDQEFEQYFSALMM